MSASKSYQTSKLQTGFQQSNDTQFWEFKGVILKFRERLQKSRDLSCSLVKQMCLHNKNAFRLKNNHNNNENNVTDINTGDRFCQQNNKKVLPENLQTFNHINKCKTARFVHHLKRLRQCFCHRWLFFFQFFLFNRIIGTSRSI